jgi:hypothetical protein
MKAACIATAVGLAMLAEGAMAGGKAFSPPTMAPPAAKADSPSENPNPRFQSMKARSIARAAERGITERVEPDANSQGGVVIRDSKFKGDVVFVLPSATPKP